MKSLLNRFLLNTFIIVMSMAPVSDGLAVQQTLRRQVILRQDNVCGLCKTKFSRMVPHEIHHLNHNAIDNNSSNLVALCANCHNAHHRFNVTVNQIFNYTPESKRENVYYEELK